MHTEKITDIEQINPDERLDTQDMGCPMPLLKAKKILEKMASGQILELLGNDPVSKKDIPGWCLFTGHQFLGIIEESAFFKMYIKKA